MDKLLEVLGKQLRKRVRMEVKHLHQRLGATVAYVVHDQGEALAMSDRMVVFHQGGTQQIRPPHNLYEQLRNTLAANSIGENNRLSGQLLSRDSERCAVGLSRGEEAGALAVNVSRPGEPVTLSIHPERVCLNGASESCVNRFSGHVVELVYLDDYVCVHLEACGHGDFLAKQPTAELDPTLNAGDVVPLGWQIEYVRVLDPPSVA